MTSNETDPVLQAARSYLEAKHTTLWADFLLDRPDRREAAAQWLTQQVHGLSEFYREPGEPEAAGTGAGAGGTGRPSALITHGQQAEVW